MVVSSDYPPRIHVNLSAPEETSGQAELKIAGVEDEHSFLIANESKSIY